MAVVELKGAVAAALGILDERQRMIVERYFGLGGASRLNLAEIGEVLGVSRGRVRQLRDRALARLRDECGLSCPGWPPQATPA
ncbi:MAG: sigma factor-like helix-turn-helix DNA-binding protein [bacterium]